VSQLVHPNCNSPEFNNKKEYSIYFLLIFEENVSAKLVTNGLCSPYVGISI